MGFLVGDQIDNQTERHIAVSVRLAALGIAAGAVCSGLAMLIWAFSRL